MKIIIPLVLSGLAVFTGCSDVKPIPIPEANRRNLDTPESNRRAKDQRKRYLLSQEIWKQKTSKIHPRARIESVSPLGDVWVLAYLPSIRYKDLSFYVGKEEVAFSFAGEPATELGKSRYRFNLHVENLKTGKYQISVKDMSTGDIDRAWVQIRDGKSYLISKR